MLPVVAAADDTALQEILQNSKAIVNDADKAAGADANALKGIDPTQEEDADWMTGSPVRPVEQRNPGETAQQRGWNQIMGHVEAQAPAIVDEGPPRPAVPNDVMYVYFSLSMPEETIRSLFLQALQDDPSRTVIFVLRGWDAPGPNRLVARLNALFPDAEKLRQLPNVQINPTLYQQQGIETVPTFTTKDAAGKWGAVIGSTSIVDAIDRIEKGQYDNQVIGPTFNIEEPDILKLIQARIAQVDWKAHVDRAKKDLLTKATVGRALPYASESESYLVDLTIVNNNDLRGAEGEVFAPAGVSINPFDYMTTQKRYIFFDANSEEQVQQALAWRNQYDYTTMITTEPVRTVEGRKQVIQILGQPVHEVNELLISRFRLKAVPSIAYQEGKMLRVDVAETTRLVAKTAGGESQ